MSSRRNGGKSLFSDKKFFIVAGIIALLAIAVLLSAFGYFVRTAVYSPVAVATPSPSSTPICKQLTDKEITSILDQMHALNKQIMDLDSDIQSLKKDEAGLRNDASKLNAQLNKTKNQQTKKFLQTQLDIVNTKIGQIILQISGIIQQQNHYREQMNQLQDELNRGCEPPA